MYFKTIRSKIERNFCEGEFSRSRSVQLIEVLSQNYLSLWGKIKVLIAPPGTRDID